MIDLDFFKSYNDTYGHQKGDDCLKKVANVIEAAMKRPADMAARFGGEEFVLVLPETSYKGAMLSLIHICRCRRIERCRSRWSPYH